LQPQLLYELARAADFDATQDYHLFDCIECGCCAYVCPSRIPLVHFYRYAKSAIESLDEERDAADRAKSRFEGRLQRLAAAAESGRQQYEYADATGLGRAEMERAIEESVARERARRAPSDDQTGHDG
jgi:electron transport complex protein RnfC